MKKLLIIATLFIIKGSTPVTAQTLTVINNNSCGLTITFNFQAEDHVTGCGAEGVSIPLGPGSIFGAEGINDFNSGGAGPAYWNNGLSIGAHPAWSLCQTGVPGMGSTSVGSTSCFGGFPLSSSFGVGSLGCPSGVTLTWSVSGGNVTLTAN